MAWPAAASKNASANEPPNWKRRIPPSEWKGRYDEVRSLSGLAIYDIDRITGEVFRGAGAERVPGSEATALNRMSVDWFDLSHPRDRRGARYYSNGPAGAKSLRRRCANTIMDEPMIALFDIGNTHTHIGLANSTRVLRHTDIPTRDWRGEAGRNVAARFLKGQITGAILCSVAPAATPMVAKFLKSRFHIPLLQLTAETVRGVGIDYPEPDTIGPDRLANAVAVRRHFGAPAVVVDFGTAVTFDVVDKSGNYIGGIIAPGLNAMSDYLHEKTALLPRIAIREIKAVIGKNTEEAMLIGAVHGYRGLIRELVGELKGALKCPRLPVVATGGYARLISAKLPEVTAVRPLLTLEGLRLVWEAHARERDPKGGQAPCDLQDSDV
jgi:type III pantothenate kinase